jgi:hypothetical protein
VFGGWVFGSIGCYFWIFFDNLCCCASVYGLLMVAVKRFVAVSRPLDLAWQGQQVRFVYISLV